MLPLNATNHLNVIFFPWEYQESLSRRIAVWATFFFIGWLYHPLTFVHRCYKKLKDGGKIDVIGKKILLRDPISKALATFNNSLIKGQINGIYITTNETNLATTRQLLQEHPKPALETIHVGCATWHNLDIMCERKSDYGLIIDFNPKNAEFIEKTINIIQTSASREVFKQSMIAYLNSLESKQRDLFFHRDQHGLPTDRIEEELTRKGSWLQSEETYLFIKKLASKDRLIAITEDITNFEVFAQLRKFLDSNNMVIDTLYLSNICNFMRTDSDKNAFTKSVKHMLAPDTVLINCPKLRQLDTNHTTILSQKTILGKKVLANSYDTKKLFEEAIYTISRK